MIQLIRRHVTSWVTKLILGIVILSFVFFWGIGDVLRGKRSNEVARVAAHSITPQDFMRELQRAVKNLEERTKSPLTLEMIAESGLVYNILNEMINGALLDAEANHLGIIIPNSLLQKQLQAIPLFQDENGHFSRAKFKSSLQELGMTENHFIDTLAHDLKRQQLVEYALMRPLEQKNLAPLGMTKGLYQWFYGMRHLETVSIPYEMMKIPAAPTAQDLADFYNRHLGRFLEAEKRSITVAWIDPEKQSRSLEISDADIQKFYEENISNFTSPQQRAVEHLILDTPEQAYKAQDLLSQSKSLAKVAAQFLQPLEKKTLKREDMPVQIAQEVFTLQEKETTRPLKHDQKYHILKVAKIIPAHQKPLAEVKSEIKKTLQQEKFYADINNRLKTLEDDLAGGTSLTEVAEKYTMTLAGVKEIQAGGNESALEKIPEAIWGDVITQAFKTPVKETTPLFQTEKGFYVILSVDSVSPSHQPALEDVKEKVIELWKEKTRKFEAEKISKELISQSALDKSLKKAALEKGFKLVIKSIALTDEQSDTPPQILQELIEMKIGEARLVQLSDSYRVIYLRSIDQAAENPKALKDWHEKISTQWAIGISDGYLQKIRQREKVQIYPEVIQAMMARQGSE